MKTNLFVIIGILALMSVAMIGPVTAADTGTAYGYGNLPTLISITLNQTNGIYLNLTPEASPATNTSLGITVSSNFKKFHVTVRDNSGRGSDIGFLGNWTTGSLYQTSPDDTNLTKPLSITGDPNGTTSGGSVTLLTSTGQNLYSGNGNVKDQLLTNTFSQVVMYEDEPLQANYQYRIDLQFTITTV